MADNKIPDDVRRFILNNIPSIPYLEAILLLRNEPARRWSDVQVAERLYVSETTVTAILSDLVTVHIASASADIPPSYQFSPWSTSLGETIDQVAETYASHLVEITNLIHSKNSKKAQLFADAFKWGED